MSARPSSSESMQSTRTGVPRSQGTAAPLGPPQGPTHMPTVHVADAYCTGCLISEILLYIGSVQGDLAHKRVMKAHSLFLNYVSYFLRKYYATGSRLPPVIEKRRKTHDLCILIIEKHTHQTMPRFVCGPVFTSEVGSPVQGLLEIKDTHRPSRVLP